MDIDPNLVSRQSISLFLNFVSKFSQLTLIYFNKTKQQQQRNEFVNILTGGDHNSFFSVCSIK